MARIIAYVTNLYTIPLFPLAELEFALRNQVLVFHRSEDLLAYLARYYETIQSNSHFESFHLPSLLQSKNVYEDVFNGINMINYYLPLHSRLRYSGISVESVVVNNQLILPDPDYAGGHFAFDISNDESLQFFMDLLQPNIHYREMLQALQEVNEAEEQRKSTSLSRQISSPTSSSLLSISEEDEEEAEEKEQGEAKATETRRSFHNTPPDQILYATSSTTSGEQRFSRPSPVKATQISPSAPSSMAMPQLSSPPPQRSSPFQSMLNWFRKSRPSSVH